MKNAWLTSRSPTAAIGCRSGFLRQAVRCIVAYRPRPGHIVVGPIALIVMLGGLSACASVPVVPLHGPIADFARLAGEWDGTYTSRDADRSGSLWFKLVAGEDHAHGDVQMTPDGSVAYSRYGLGTYPQAPQRDVSRFLTIRFVRAAGDAIDGRLDPYWDPSCQCTAETAFRGRLIEGALRGTFVTRLSNGAQALGQWEALRRR